MHYTRWWKWGDPLVIKKLQRIESGTPCGVTECEYDAISRGYCSKHYQRLKNNGDPIALQRREKGTGSIINGYHIVTNGTVREGMHRVVLRESIGGGEHPCHWCSKIVSWDESWPASLTALVVDHLDHDKLNNAPDNLVPACGGCNVARTRV